MNTNLNPENLDKVLNFLHRTEKLKSTVRFLERKDMVRESSAAHSWKLALMYLKKD